MSVKMGWIQIKMGHPLARNGAALAPFRANGAHPSTENRRRDWKRAHGYNAKSISVLSHPCCAVR